MSRIRIALATTPIVFAFGVIQAQAADDIPLSREQVRAEYFKARAEGASLPSGEVGFLSGVEKPARTLERAHVIRELSIQGPTSIAEGAELAYARPSGSMHSRAEIHAEAVEAVRACVRLGGEL